MVEKTDHMVTTVRSPRSGEWERVKRIAKAYQQILSDTGGVISCNDLPFRPSKVDNEYVSGVQMPNMQIVKVK